MATPSEAAQAAERLDSALAAADLPNGARLLLAVSGGPDSTALLQACFRAAPEHAWTLAVGHVDHGLRGVDSARDARWVEGRARALGLPVFVRAVNTPRLAAAERLSIETAARTLRYRALFEVLDEWGGDLLLTAHTEEDQAETVLMNLLRGSGLDGLAGMPRRNRRLVRPFLGINRGTIISALDRELSQYLTDPTNEDRRYTRNRVRHEVLPLLERMRPGAPHRIAHTAGLLRHDADYLHEEAESALREMELRFDERGVNGFVGPWRSLHPGLRGHILRRLLVLAGGPDRDIGQIHIELLDGALRRGQRLDGLPGDLTFRVRDGRFTICTPAPPPLTPKEVTLTVPGAVSWGGWRLEAHPLSDGGSDLPALLAVCGALHALCALPGVASLQVRARRPGDRIQPVGMKGTKKLQDILVDARVPAGTRNRIPIVESEGQIVWVPGYVLDRRTAAEVGSDFVVHLLCGALTDMDW